MAPALVWVVGNWAAAGLQQRAARLGQVGRGDLQVGVLGQRLLHQPVERRVLVEPPPMSGGGCGGHGLGPGGGETKRAGRAAGVGGWR